jgi:hypothetical protein
MTTTHLTLSTFEDQCKQIGSRLDGEQLGIYTLTDIETALTLLADMLDLYVQDYTREFAGSDEAIAARAARNTLRQRLDAIWSYRHVLEIDQVRRFLLQAQRSMLDVIRALRTKPPRINPSLVIHGNLITK